jgi:hypothetical protein
MNMNEDNSAPLYRLAFPYCIQKQEDGSYVVLNRNYKPVGFTISGERIDYGKFPVQVRFKRLNEETIKKLSIDGDPDDSTIYFYGDGSKPTQSKEKMNAYLERLAVLMSLEVY